jgi:hypothetical protein
MSDTIVSGITQYSQLDDAVCVATADFARILGVSKSKFYSLKRQYSKFPVPIFGDRYSMGAIRRFVQSVDVQSDS